MTRTISTACWSVTALASSRGAVPNTSPTTAGLVRSGCLIQSTKAATPACATRPSQDLCSADMPRNQGSRRSIASIAAVPSAAHRGLEPADGVVPDPAARAATPVAGGVTRLGVPGHALSLPTSSRDVSTSAVRPARVTRAPRGAGSARSARRGKQVPDEASATARRPARTITARASAVATVVQPTPMCVRDRSLQQGADRISDAERDQEEAEHAAAVCRRGVQLHRCLTGRTARPCTPVRPRTGASTATTRATARAVADQRRPAAAPGSRRGRGPAEPGRERRQAAARRRPRRRLERS